MCSAGRVVTYHTIHKSYRNFAFIKVSRYFTPEFDTARSSKPEQY